MSSNNCKNWPRLHRKAPVASATWRTWRSRYVTSWLTGAATFWMCSVTSITIRCMSTRVMSSSWAAPGSEEKAQIVCSNATCSFDQSGAEWHRPSAPLRWSVNDPSRQHLTSPGTGVCVFGFVGDVHSVVRCGCSSAFWEWLSETRHSFGSARIHSVKSSSRSFVMPGLLATPSTNIFCFVSHTGSTF